MITHSNTLFWASLALNLWSWLVYLSGTSLGSSSRSLQSMPFLTDLRHSLCPAQSISRRFQFCSFLLCLVTIFFGRRRLFHDIILVGFASQTQHRDKSLVLQLPSPKFVSSNIILTLFLPAVDVYSRTQSCSGQPLSCHS